MLAADVEGGQTVGKKWKLRSDKGKKCKRAMATDDDNDNDDKGKDKEEEENNDDDENEQLLIAKKQKSAASSKKPKGPANKSKAATTPSKSKASAAKKAKWVAGTLSPTAPKSKEFIDTKDESDHWNLVLPHIYPCWCHIYCYNFDRFRLYSRDRSQSVSDNAQAYVQGASWAHEYQLEDVQYPQVWEWISQSSSIVINKVTWLKTS